MSRPIISSEADALRNLSAPLSRPTPLERDLSLPLDRLTWDEFEVFCYLLLRQEHPGDEIVYHGKTADLGRDIVRRRRDGGIELVQCKCYSEKLSLGEVRAELAKLFTNLFSRVIPESPTCIFFYVARDLTAPALRLLDQERWAEAAEKALTDHLKTAPSPDLLSFARTWWPAEGVHAEPGIHLTVRAERHPELVDKFFRAQKVIDGSVADIQAGVKVALAEIFAERETSSSFGRVSGNTWEDFFATTKTPDDTASQYLNGWPGLKPEERFEAPQEFSAIQESVQSQPLTILIGPPAAGKTFIALQLLWAAFQKRSRVRWIAPATFVPTDGPIPAERGLPDIRQRVEVLTTTLGVTRFRAPLDRHEFITANLEPESTVYIEDPFGKRDDEFEHSLHTYKFFDLDECVAAITDGAERTGCHILLSSREGLFDRWQTERARKDLPPLPAQLIRISGKSYTHDQLEALAIRLGGARGLERPEDIAFKISYRVSYPYEIESILRALPRNADVEQAVTEAMKYRDGLKSALRKILVAEDNQEMLFLVILASGCADPKTRYLRLHQALDLAGDAESSLDRVVGRYRAFVVRRPALGIRGFGPDADEVFSSSHPVVEETVLEYFRESSADAGPFLERLACSLPKGALDRKSTADQANIALCLLSLGACQPGPAQDAILNVLLDLHGFSPHHVLGLMHLWSALGVVFKDRLLTHLRSGLHQKDFNKNTRMLLVEMASNLTSVELPANDAWGLIRLLFRVFRNSSGRHGVYTWQSPWLYLLEHLEEAPDDVLQVLEKIANARPNMFVYVLGGVAVAYWEKLSESHKAAFFAESSLKSTRVQERVLQGIAENWEDVPGELRSHFIDQTANEDPEIRSAAATAAWIYRRHDPVLGKVVLDSAGDADATVPLSIMYLLGDDEEDRLFARSFFDRADASRAAEMLHDLLRSSEEPLSGWKLDLARECLVKGGDPAWSILATLHFGKGMTAADPLHNWCDSIKEEPEPIRLGALWAYGRSAGGSPKLDPDEVLSLIKGLSHPCRSLALAYFSAQVERLPPYLQEFMTELEAVADKDGDAVRTGKEKRGSNRGNNPWSALSLAGG